MFRKIAFALAATAAIGAASLAPTVASARPFGHGPAFHHGFGGPGAFHHGFGGPRFYGPHRYGYRGWPLGVGIAAGLIGGAIVADGCYRREVIDTPYGPQYSWVNVCY